MNTLTEPRPGPTIKNNATLINQTSGGVEYYTPIEIVNAARRVMDRIELDPASSSLANDRVGGVGADTWFGIEDRSLERGWSSWSVWLNHPFGRAEEACAPDCQKHLKSPRHKHHSFELFGNAAWINKLVREFEIGNVKEACCITYACTSEQWFQPLLKRVQCFLVPRTNYYLPDGSVLKGVTKGSVVTYFGSRPKRFAEIFSKLGVVKTTL